MSVAQSSFINTNADRMAHSIRFPRRHDKADRSGRYAVRLCITKNKRRKYIALDLYADPAYWDEAGEQFIILRNLKGAEQKAENKHAKPTMRCWRSTRFAPARSSNASRSKVSTGH